MDRHNYLCYHLHDDEGSVLDSCTKYQDYIDLAVKNGMTAIGSSNHGYILNWTSKKLAAEKAGLEPRFCIVAEDAIAGIMAAKAAGISARSVSVNA